MKFKNKLFIVATVVAVLVFGAAVIFLLPKLNAFQAPNEDQGSLIGYGSNAVEAVVVEIEDEGIIQLGDIDQTYQVLKVEILEGEYQGIELSVDYGKQQLRPPGLDLKPGDKVFLEIYRSANNLIQARFLDFKRVGPLFILFGTFVFFSVLISGWKGVRGLLGMVISIGVIILFIIPQILAGKNPILISVTGAFFLLAITLYLIYGWTLKTHSAVVGILLSLILTAFLANCFVDLTRMTGYGNEDTLFLMQQSTQQINMQGLLLGGILIGALGVLDDLVITQASVVFELYGLDSGLSIRDLYKRAMRVGQDHVAATVNTLVLAYVGAALPMFLLFSISGAQISYLINLEYVAEEVVRTMVGSLGLIAAVPLTTYLSSLVAIRSAGPEKIWRFLGPATSGQGRSSWAPPLTYQ